MMGKRRTSRPGSGCCVGIFGLMTWDGPLENEWQHSWLVNMVANSKKESFCHSILLSILPEEQARNATNAVETVVRGILVRSQNDL
jgi:hypothetical protein